jgi:hypothetical protein
MKRSRSSEERVCLICGRSFDPKYTKYDICDHCPSKVGSVSASKKPVHTNLYMKMLLQNLAQFPIELLIELELYARPSPLVFSCHYAADRKPTVESLQLDCDGTRIYASDTQFDYAAGESLRFSSDEPQWYVRQATVWYHIGSSVRLDKKMYPWFRTFQSLRVGSSRSAHVWIDDTQLMVLGGEDQRGCASNQVTCLFLPVPFDPSLFRFMDGFRQSLDHYPVDHDVEQVPPLPIGLFGLCAVFVPNHAVYVMGGYGSTPSKRVWKFETKQWEEMPALNVARVDATATVSVDGKVWICGGYSQNYPINSVESYDPFLPDHDPNKRWMLMEPMTRSHEKGSLSVLDDNRFLLTAPFAGSFWIEVYAPASNRWKSPQISSSF